MAGSTTANLPPDARISTPVCCVLSEDTVSKTALIGVSVIFTISVASSAVDRLRSRTAVAPIDFRCSVFLRDAVVIMGENPDIFASWMAGSGQEYNSGGRRYYQPFWPTDVAPPSITSGVPA